MNRLIAAVALSAVAVLAPALRAHPGEAPPRVDELGIGEEVEAIVERIRERDQVPGMSVSMWQGDRLVFSDGFGLADVEQNVPVTRDSRFRLASVSKLYTGSLCAKLAEQGRLDLDRDVREYVPSFPDKGHVVAIRQLLAHVGGVRHYNASDYDMTQPGSMIDLRLYPDTQSMLDLFKDDPLVHEPGTAVQYSTFAFTLVSAAIEGATGEAFMDVLRAEILDPLGLERTVADELMRITPNRVAFYEISDRTGGQLALAPPINASYKIAGGGLLAPADEVVEFAIAHLDGAVVGEAMLDEMWTTQQTDAGEDVGVGLAWRVREDPDGRRIVMHGGAQAGTRTFVMMWPEERTAVAVLCNVSGAPRDINRVAYEIAALVLDERRED